MKFFYVIFSLILQNVIANQTQDLSFSQTYESLEMNDITPKAIPVVRCGYDITIEASYLLWQPFEKGLAIAQGSVPLPGSSSASNILLPQGNKIRPDFKLSSGFKVGVGFEFDYDGWRTDLVYTWFQSNASAAFYPSLNAENLTLWEGNFNVISYGQYDNLALFPNISNQGNSNWKLHFNVVDWLIHRNFFLNKTLVFDLFFGFKASYLTQNYFIHYIQKGISSTLILPPATEIIIGIAQEDYRIFNKIKYGGVGPKIGFNGVFQLSKSCGLIFDLALSSLYGKFNVQREDFSDVIDVTGKKSGITNYNALNLIDTFWQINPVLENSLGFKWDLWSCNERYRYQIRAAWETQVWFDQNQFLQPGLYGNLTLQGLNFLVIMNF